MRGTALLETSFPELASHMGPGSDVRAGCHAMPWHSVLNAVSVQRLVV